MSPNVAHEQGHQLGKIAELYAQQFFVRKGYQLLAKTTAIAKPSDLIVRQKNIVGEESTLYDYYAIRVHL